MPQIVFYGRIMAQHLFQTGLSILAGIVVALISGYIADVRDKQRRLRDEFYPELLKEFDRILDNKERARPSPPTQQEFDYRNKYWLDPCLRDEVEDFLSICQRWQDLIETELVTSEFVDSLPSGMAERSGNEFVFAHGSTGYIECGKFLSKFSESISTADDPHEMRTQMIELSERNNWGNERRMYSWDEEFPNWEVQLWDAMYELGIHEKLNEITRLRNELVSTSENLKEEVEVRLEEGFLKSLARRVL